MRIMLIVANRCFIRNENQTSGKLDKHQNIRREHCTEV